MGAARPLMGFGVPPLPRSLPADLVRIRRSSIGAQPEHGAVATSVSLALSNWLSLRGWRTTNCLAVLPPIKRASSAGGLCELLLQRLGLRACALLSAMRCQKPPQGQQHGQERRRTQQEILQGQGAWADRRGCDRL